MTHVHGHDLLGNGLTGEQVVVAAPAAAFDPSASGNYVVVAGLECVFWHLDRHRDLLRLTPGVGSEVDVGCVKQKILSLS
jgi:hypothetical protein